jgi:inner membrane protein
VSDRADGRIGPVQRRGRLTWPLLAVAAVAGLDRVQRSRDWPVPIAGALDEPAHLLTAGLLLAAAPRRPLPELAAWALAGSVAIDADHVPLYLGHMPTTVEGGRPVTHSLPTVGALLLAAAATRGRVRTALAGLGAGVCLHFVRDFATGGVGVPLFWPAVRRGDVRVPYSSYLIALGVAGVAAAARPGRRPGGLWQASSR